MQRPLSIDRRWLRSLTPAVGLKLTIESPRRLLDLLLKRHGSGSALFKNAAQIAEHLSALPNAKYTKPKSTEVLLSQIGSAQKPIPAELKKEVLRLVESRRDLGAAELDQLKIEIESSVASHNSALKHDKWAGAKEKMHSAFFDVALNVNSREQYLFISSASLEGENSLIRAMLRDHVYATRIIEPGRSSLTNYSRKDTEWDRTLWSNSPEELLIRYFVDSDGTAHKLWKLLFAEAATDQIAGPKSSQFRADPMKVLDGIAQRFSHLDRAAYFRISVLRPPLHLLCSNTVVAINPSSPDSCSIFTITDGWAVRLSANESYSWRNIVYHSRGDLLKGARASSWIDVAPEVVDETAFFGPLGA